MNFRNIKQTEVWCVVKNTPHNKGGTMWPLFKKILVFVGLFLVTIVLGLFWIISGLDALYDGGEGLFNNEFSTWVRWANK